MDQLTIAKLSAVTLKLAQLKYVQDDVQCKFIAAVFNVLKAGVGFSTAVSKYNSTGDNSSARLLKDSEDKGLLKLGLSISGFLDSVQTFQKLKSEISVTAGLGDDSVNLFSFDAEAVFSKETLESWETFFDSLGLRANKLKDFIERCGSNLKKLCQGIDASGDNHWRAGCADDADLPTLRNLSKTALKKMDGTQLKSAVENTSKARLGLAWLGFAFCSVIRI